MNILKTEIEIEKYIDTLKNRDNQVQEHVLKDVDKILKDVKDQGDRALLEYTYKFDGVLLKDFKVSREEMKRAYEKADKSYIDALKISIENIKNFHQRQLRNSWIDNGKEGIILGQQIRPLKRVGVYVPGGKATYPSSVLMNVIPTKVAGVEEVIMVTPPDREGKVNQVVLAAAYMAGVDNIYKVGGVQAIGALAYGTESIDKVDKIVGPGNIYVALAKKQVFGNVDIDMIAGPSEILVIGDEYANEKFVSADLISQAEHDELASSILVTTSEELGKKVQVELRRQIEERNRKEIIEKSLNDYGVIIVVKNMEKAIEVANKIGPEHLELMVKDPFVYLGQIKNAGSVFLGAYSPEPLGDYMAGPNHVLPTNTTARFFSPLGVDDFIKKSSYIYYSKEALENIGENIINFANVEGLDGHGNSIKVRLEE
ncbi:MAG: histidinol dehydrogenase [Anaeromicrobium sp.]|uniref:histidinol dehydrogenase n=1 Tax=Anaeromicrobium sp. TaxID=1929132 RepID=UPI0025CCDED8|nr:histidinol dehydrogenase [Anaeromicrobium sp.]MCT4593896.1 histidinol dehydrogenase [Anaeromicrobium sp.]